jgi:hypothetical protein
MLSVAMIVCVTSIIGMASAASTLCPEDDPFMLYEVVIPVTAMSAGFGLVRLFKGRIEEALSGNKPARTLQ